MSDLRQAAILALDALEHADKDGFWREQRDAITALRSALEQPAEPVAWGMPDAEGNMSDSITHDEKQTDMKGWAQQYSTPLYTAPPQRKPLTDAEFCEQWLKQTGRIMGTDKQLLLQAKQVTEVAHGIKEET